MARSTITAVAARHTADDDFPPDGLQAEFAQVSAVAGADFVRQRL